VVAKEIVEDAVAVTPYAAALGVGPSTAHLILTGANPFEVALAAGALVLPQEKRASRLVPAGFAAHGALSLGWALVLAASLPPRRTIAWSLAGGLAITALDMGVIGRRVIGRRYSRFGSLPLVPQVLDHLAFAGTVGYGVSRRRAQR
jgi:hypothetical protein